MGLRIFLRDGNEFAAKTEFENVSEYFRKDEVGLRIFLSDENRNWTWKIFVQKGKREKGSWT